MGNTFFLIFVLTILLTRLVVFFYPFSAPSIGKFRIHHYMYGILGALVGLLLGSLFIYAIGFGLFVDELTFLFIKGKTHAHNYSKPSLFGTFILMVLVFAIRNYLVRPLIK